VGADPNESDSTVEQSTELLDALRRLSVLEQRLQGEPSARKTAELAGELRLARNRLLVAEDRSWQQLGCDTPWYLYKWIAQAAAWLRACEFALEYAEASSFQFPQRHEAMKSAVAYASEAALAYTRFETTLTQRTFTAPNLGPSGAA
jgi:hypothetical protein